MIKMGFLSFFGLVSDTYRVVSRRIKRSFKPIKEYDGDFNDIIHTIVKECYYDDFFHVSNGHFRSFFTRDFCFVAKHLINLGYKKEVYKTIDFAFNQFMKKGRITTTITKFGRIYIAYDLPTYGIDSIAFFLKTIEDSKYKLDNEKLDFIQKNLSLLERRYLDEKGLPKRSLHFSSIRDLSIRRQSCYDLTMLAYIQKWIKNKWIKKNRPFNLSFKSKVNYKDYILKEYWNNEFFYNDIEKNKVFTSDSNLFLFWLDILNERTYFDKINRKIKKLKLDQPLPLKYNIKESMDKINFRFDEFLMRGYERDVIWIHLGLIYIDVLIKFKEYKQANEYLKKMKELTEKYKNFVEVLVDVDKPFKSLFYFCDESLIWGASFLDNYFRQI